MPNPTTPVAGLDLDPQTRCQHYHSPLDIIAIKMHCCQIYFACYQCHAAMSNHPATTWPQSQWNSPAVLCGHCGTELTIHQYLDSDNICPACSANFNPACSNHYHLYFNSPSPAA